MSTNEYQSIVRDTVLHDQAFVQLTLQGKVRGPDVPWRKIVVRPVLIKNRRQLQFSWFDAKQDITKNFSGDEAAVRVAEVLAIPFSSVHLRTTNEDMQVQVTKKGKAIIHRSQPVQQRAPDLTHNRAKSVPLPLEQSLDMLREVGIANQQGQIKHQMADKYAQINEFLRLFEGTGELETLQPPVKVIDCGSGSAYLTFGVYHYLSNLRSIKTEITGIDVNAHVVAKSNATRDRLGYTGLHFVQSPIENFVPGQRPDVVIALHACDTATDDAIAQGIRWGAKMILSAPCCHHDLNDAITAEVCRPILRHGILKQRLADIVTDTFRALALRIMGYRTEVIEFIDAEHTAKNLLIRAVQSTAVGDRAFVEEYNQLKAFWHVTPYIETLLGDSFTSLLA